MAAILACAEGSAASHRSSSMLFALRLATRRCVDVTIPGRPGYRRGDIHVHVGRTLTPADVTVIDRARRLIVETDGRDPHTIRKAFNADRRRDQRLMLLGWRVVRFTWQQVTNEPATVAQTLRGLL